MRTLTYYVATSLDGFIAAPDDTFDAFPVEGDHIDMIIEEFRDTLQTMSLEALNLEPSTDRFDTILMGWKTYAAGLPFGAVNPYQHLRQFVFSRSRKPDDPAVKAIQSDPLALVRELKVESEGTGIWLCGGGNLAGQLIDEIDELILKVNPVLLGSGKQLFAEAPYAIRQFDLVSSRPFTSGVVVQTYRRRISPSPADR